MGLDRGQARANCCILITVKIVIDAADGLADRLLPGMSVEARVDARDGRR